MKDMIDQFKQTIDTQHDLMLIVASVSLVAQHE
jgi:hypothetical protein